MRNGQINGTLLHSRANNCVPKLRMEMSFGFTNQSLKDLAAYVTKSSRWIAGSGTVGVVKPRSPKTSQTLLSPMPLVLRLERLFKVGFQFDSFC